MRKLYSLLEDGEQVHFGNLNSSDHTRENLIASKLRCASQRPVRFTYRGEPRSPDNDDQFVYHYRHRNAAEQQQAYILPVVTHCEICYKSFLDDPETPKRTPEQIAAFRRTLDDLQTMDRNGFLAKPNDVKAIQHVDVNAYFRCVGNANS